MHKQPITIIDYGVGNLLSVQRGLEKCNAQVSISSDPDFILTSQKIVLPGVGAFPKAMKALSDLKLDIVIKDFAKSNRPLLAICLGMQLLMDVSYEFGSTPGLGLVSGSVKQIMSDSEDHEVVKVPHIGWTGLYPSAEKENWKNSILQNVTPGEATYFVHSYMVHPTDSENLLAHAIYGGMNIPAVISKKQITGCQFHPEKSAGVGLKILESFVSS